MKCYTITAILLLALAYSAKCAPSEYVSEVESQTGDEAFEDELALELENNFENEEDLNALLTVIEQEQPDEEARGKFSVFAKILRSIAKVFKGVGKVRKSFQKASDLDKNQRIENEEDLNAFLTLTDQEQLDEEARGKFSIFGKILRSIAKVFKGVGKVRKSFQNANDLDKSQRIENEEDLNAFLTLIDQEQLDEEARGKFSIFGKILRSIAKVFKGVGKVRKSFQNANDLDKSQRIENEEDLNAFLTLIDQEQLDEEARGKFSIFGKILRSIAKVFKGVGKVRKSFQNASDLDKNQ